MQILELLPSSLSAYKLPWGSLVWHTIMNLGTDKKSLQKLPHDQNEMQWKLCHYWPVIILGCSNLIGKACVVSESYSILGMFGGVCLHLASRTKKRERECKNENVFGVCSWIAYAVNVVFRGWVKYTIHASLCKFWFARYRLCILCILMNNATNVLVTNYLNLF